MSRLDKLTLRRIQKLQVPADVLCCVCVDDVRCFLFRPLVLLELLLALSSETPLETPLGEERSRVSSVEMVTHLSYCAAMGEAS